MWCMYVKYINARVESEYGSVTVSNVVIQLVQGQVFFSMYIIVLSTR